VQKYEIASPTAEVRPVMLTGGEVLLAFLSSSWRCSDSTVRQEASASLHTEGTSLNNASAIEESAGRSRATVPAGVGSAPLETATQQSAPAPGPLTVISQRVIVSSRYCRGREFYIRQQLNWRSSNNDRRKNRYLGMFSVV
jgi:hypothetical protein